MTNSLQWFFAFLTVASTISIDNRRVCSMEECFDFEKCKTSRKVYIHPVSEYFEVAPKSLVYQQIIRFFQNSNYYTDDPNEACIFLIGVDTTDRDVRSQNYVKNLPEYLASLDPVVWNNGRNHLIFNLYHGTFPDYDDHNLNFDTGDALIARASSSENNFLQGFDVSLPLFHENHPFEAEIGEVSLDDRSSKYLVSFKGKRYVYGIGSNTRNLVHHLHNGEDIIMLTTCKHNADWQNYQDERCRADNDLYEKYDYDELNNNSTFCLVPRGRRLGSFRFLEVLRSGCIPVVVSDSWILPFAEIIDWKTAALVVSESEALSSIPELLMSTSRGKVRELKKNAIAIYAKYLRSMEVITDWTIQIIFKRVDNHFAIENQI